MGGGAEESPLIAGGGKNVGAPPREQEVGFAREKGKDRLAEFVGEGLDLTQPEWAPGFLGGLDVDHAALAVDRSHLHVAAAKAEERARGRLGVSQEVLADRDQLAGALIDGENRWRSEGGHQFRKSFRPNSAWLA